MERPSRMTAQPGDHLGVLVGGIVVKDGVDGLAGRDLALNGVEKADELLMPVALHAAADDLAFQNTAVLLTPAVRMISTVPRPSAVASTIWARQTCFCELLRSSTIARRRLRSVGLRWTVTPLRIPQTRMADRPWESQQGLKRQHQSTSGLMLTLESRLLAVSRAGSRARFQP